MSCTQLSALMYANDLQIGVGSLLTQYYWCLPLRQRQVVTVIPLSCTQLSALTYANGSQIGVGSFLTQ